MRRFLQKRPCERNMLLKGACIRGATYAHPDQIIGGIDAPHAGNPLSAPSAYSAGFHTAPASQIFSAQAQISSETTIQKHYDFERRLDSVGYLCPPRSNRRGVLLSPKPRIRYRTPVTYSDGFHTVTASQIFSLQAHISSETTLLKHYTFERHLDLGGILMPIPTK